MDDVAEFLLIGFTLLAVAFAFVYVAEDGNLANQCVVQEHPE